MGKENGGVSSYFFCYRAMSERVCFLLFYEHEKTMTWPLFPYCCCNNWVKIPLLESCCACSDANIGHHFTHDKL